VLSISKQKLINSLSQKKFRDQTGLFVAEGAKLIVDMAAGGLECVLLAATEQWLSRHYAVRCDEQFAVSDKELQKLSNQKAPQGALALFRQPESNFSFAELKNHLCLALDEVQDPGNLGTIIRIADWFGIKHIFCSETSADAFSPKTVQATMGALARVKVHRVALTDFLSTAKAHDIEIYGTFLDGKNIYESSLSPCGIVVMGNESNGVSAGVAALISGKLLIPSFPANAVTSESLNVSVATAVVCAEFRRRIRFEN
jgi:TrmH family RNA methyltransferase